MEEKEIWKPIPGYPGYEVSNLGRVKSFKWSIPRILKPSFTNGYSGVNLYLKGANLAKRKQRRYVRVHFLVMLAFVGPRPTGLEVCHGDGNPVNNRLDNLRYDTHQANVDDISKYGSRGWFTREQAKAARSEYSRNHTSPKEIAEKYGVPQSAVYNVLRGRTHQDDTSESCISPRVLKARRNEEIELKYVNGQITMTQLSREYNLSISAISRMLSKIKATLLILFILLSALLWAVKPAQAMRQESRIQPATLEEALNISLAMGDYRKIDFAPFGLSWEG